MGGNCRVQIGTAHTRQSLHLRPNGWTRGKKARVSTPEKYVHCHAMSGVRYGEKAGIRTIVILISLILVIGYNLANTRGLAYPRSIVQRTKLRPSLTVQPPLTVQCSSKKLFQALHVTVVLQQDTNPWKRMIQ